MQIKRTIQQQKGFTLFEVIVTLVIMSIIGLGASSFLVYGVQGFMLAKANNEVFQKTNLALERLVRETKQFDEIYQKTSDSMRYQRDGQAFGLALVGNTIQIIRANLIPSSANPGSILIDNINSFSIQFQDSGGNAWAIPSDNSLTGLAKITIRMTVAIENTSKSFSVDITPFYNNMVNGPTS